jgi:hypothetical protein
MGKEIFLGGRNRLFRCRISSSNRSRRSVRPSITHNKGGNATTSVADNDFATLRPSGSRNARIDAILVWKRTRSLEETVSRNINISSGSHTKALGINFANSNTPTSIEINIATIGRGRGVENATSGDLSTAARETNSAR